MGIIITVMAAMAVTEDTEVTVSYMKLALLEVVFMIAVQNYLLRCISLNSLI